MDLTISWTLHPAPGLQTGGHLSVSSAAKSRTCSTGWWQIARFLLLLLLLTIITVINVSSGVTYLDKCVSFSFSPFSLNMYSDGGVFLKKLNAFILMSKAAGRYSLFFSMIDLKQDGMFINLRFKKSWLWKQGSWCYPVNFSPKSKFLISVENYK